MPAYNAERTLERTYLDLPEAFRENVILVDDGSADGTVRLAESLGLRVIVHEVNRGYGANQKTCYDAALASGAEIVVMLHPDYQYDARVVGVMADIIRLGICDVVLGNRIRTRQEALAGGMPLWKYIINRISTLFENLVLGQSIGDFHSGLRAYRREVLQTIPYRHNGDDFGFDQEFLVEAVCYGFRVGDIPVPVRYMKEASSINFRRSLRYGLAGLGALASYQLTRVGLRRDARFEPRLKPSQPSEQGTADLSF